MRRERNTPLDGTGSLVWFWDGALKWSNVARSHRRGPRVNRSSPSLTKGKRGMKSERVTGCDNKSDHSVVS